MNIDIAFDLIQKIPYQKKGSFGQLFKQMNKRLRVMLRKMLHYDPKRRPDLQTILQDPYFDEVQKSENRESEDIQIVLPIDDNVKYGVNVYYKGIK